MSFGAIEGITEMANFARKVIAEIKSGKRNKFRTLRGDKCNPTGLLCRKCNSPLVEVGLDHKRMVSLLVCKRCHRTTMMDVGMVVFHSKINVVEGE
jgi:transcription elongation factor Elf1